MNQAQLIISFVSVIVMFIPIGTLLWKFSKIVFEVELNKKDINSLAEELRRRLDKTDKRIDERLAGNEARLSNIEITIGRMEEKINILLETRGG
jgi:hypothetical protein